METGEVKTVVATVALALGAYQLVLIALAYRGNAATGTAHRFNGRAIAILLAALGVACLSVYGWEDDYLLHGAGGVALAAILAFKVAVVRRGLGLSRFLPVFGIVVFALLALTWATTAVEVLRDGGVEDDDDHGALVIPRA